VQPIVHLAEALQQILHIEAPAKADGVILEKMYRGRGPIIITFLPFAALMRGMISRKRALRSSFPTLPTLSSEIQKRGTLTSMTRRCSSCRRPAWQDTATAIVNLGSFFSSLLRKSDPELVGRAKLVGNTGLSGQYTWDSAHAGQSPPPS
jgi:hypothetical protein